MTIFRETHPVIPSNFYLAKTLREMVSSPGEKRVLEIGTGYGKDIDHLRRAGFAYTGIDSSPEMIEEVKKEHPYLNVEVGDLRHLQFSDRFFDAVWSSSVYHHIPREQLPHAFIELRRVLKDNGVAFLRLRGGGNFSEVDSRGLFFEHYSQDSFIEILQAHGFAVERFRVVKTSSTQVPPDTEYIEVFVRKSK